MKNWTEGKEKKKSRVSPTAYAISKGAYEDKSYLTSDGKASGWWWLRAPSRFIHDASCVSFDGLYYNIVDYTSNYGSCGVDRPALWIDLESIPD